MGQGQTITNQYFSGLVFLVFDMFHASNFEYLTLENEGDVNA